MMAPIANVRRALCALRMDLSPAEFWLAMGLVGLDIVARLAPHAPNFTPVAASALFAGTVLRGRALALSVPLAAMLISDLVLGCPDARVMGVVYAALALPALLVFAQYTPRRHVLDYAFIRRLVERASLARAAAGRRRRA